MQATKSKKGVNSSQRKMQSEKKRPLTIKHIPPFISFTVFGVMVVGIHVLDTCLTQRFTFNIFYMAAVYASVSNKIAEIDIAN